MRHLALALGLSLAVPTLAAAEPTYNVDAVHSSVVFEVGHLGVSTFFGRFNTIEGTFVLDAADPSKSAIDLTVRVDSIDTANEKRDAHLKSPDFFNAKQFPVIRFVGTKFEASGDSWKVTGDFTLHGVTQEITVPFRVIGEGDDPWGGHRKGASAEFTLSRSAYGIDYMPGGVGDELTLHIALEGVK